MNRKNLTAAVLAGLAGAAGIAGTAQAVNMNPDGLGQVLIYPYYTSNMGNQTLISVVNTTDNAKAVKVRFLEGYNSREVLDFNLYMSEWDVWVAAVAAGENAPTLYIPDTTCTVPYLYEDAQQVINGTPMGVQPFLEIAYSGVYNDGGPEGILRAAEGHVEVIEMGTLMGDAADAARHETTGDGRFPADCDYLVEQWTIDSSGNGLWLDEAAASVAVGCDDDFKGDPTDPDDVADYLEDFSPTELDAYVRGSCAEASTFTERNSGGLFGAASVINAVNGTMFSYDAKAIQGFDKTDDGIHYRPGLVYPGLDSGSEETAWIFFGAPTNEAVELGYNRGVDAVSATFMHENLMNEYTIDESASASTEWVITFPTKSFYVDDRVLEDIAVVWQPDPSDGFGCNGWTEGDPNPVLTNDQGYTVKKDGDPNDWPEPFTTGNSADSWVNCDFIEVAFDNTEAYQPFTEVFDGESCDLVSLQTWDREEDTFEPDSPGGSIPPVVSPSVPGDCDPSLEVCDTTPFELCYEVNVLRFGDGEIFGTPTIDGSSLLLEVENQFDTGWGRIDLHNGQDEHVDFAGLMGLPATGFAAIEFENNFAEGSTVKAYYGGLFGHKGNVRRTLPPICDERPCGSFPISVGN